MNAIKKLNGEPYDEFQGYVFQDSDIYKSIEAISYTLSVINDDTDPEMVAQKAVLEDKLAYWISLIEQVQYADGRRFRMCARRRTRPERSGTVAHVEVKPVDALEEGDDA